MRFVNSATARVWLANVSCRRMDSRRTQQSAWQAPDHSAAVDRGRTCGRYETEPLRPMCTTTMASMPVAQGNQTTPSRR